MEEQSCQLAERERNTDRRVLTVSTGKMKVDMTWDRLGNGMRKQRGIRRLAMEK